jgi:hypothetical protein
MAHWPSSTGPCGPFCTCCPARHAAGLPLNSNVRPHVTPRPNTLLSFELPRTLSLTIPRVFQEQDRSKTAELQVGDFKPRAKRGFQGNLKPRALLPQGRELGYHHKNAKPKCSASFLVVPVLRWLRSAAAVRRDVMPNPSFKGEAQRQAARPGPRCGHIFLGPGLAAHRRSPP